MSALPPPPPPLPPANVAPVAAPAAAPRPKPPVVAAEGPAGAFLVELLIYNGSPFKDHWAYWVCSHTRPDLGVLIHAAGDVRHGFSFQIKRCHDFKVTGTQPTTTVPLQWVDGRLFNEEAMFNGGVYKADNKPVCGFETSLYQVKVPEKSLNAVDDTVCFQL
jgi:hypothetical protein